MRFPSHALMKVAVPKPDGPDGHPTRLDIPDWMQCVITGIKRVSFFVFADGCVDSVANMCRCPSADQEGLDPLWLGSELSGLLDNKPGHPLNYPERFVISHRVYLRTSGGSD